MANGLGSEGGIVIDLKGSMPKIPGLPADFVKNGKVPRISIYNSVKNRKQLAEAWEQWFQRLMRLLRHTWTSAGPRVSDSRYIIDGWKNLTTHFIGLPFVSNDFLPSLSISDELFFLSTSKKATDEIAAAIIDNKDKEMNGLVLRVNVEATDTFAKSWVSLIEKNEDH